MKGICPNCEKKTDLELVRTTDEIEVRGERIAVEAEYYKCSVCGEEFDDPRSDDDPLDKAYREYRRRRGMSQPEDIRALRTRYGLTQGELSKLLGWGATTLSRYENGALQDEAHEKTFRLAMEPRNLLRLIEETSEAVPQAKRTRLLAQLRGAEEDACSLSRVYEEWFGRYEPTILSGFRRLDTAKVFDAILFFCRDGIFKTNLNKLLFYADFKHFKDNKVSITGLQYAKIRLGPVPDNWSHYCAWLLNDGALEADEVYFDENVSGEKLSSAKKPDLNRFSETELETLLFVIKHFKGWTAKRISDFSHQEVGYRETANRQLISYAYADALQI